MHSTNTDYCTNCSNLIEGYLPYIISHACKPNLYLCKTCFYEHIELEETKRGFAGEKANTPSSTAYQMGDVAIKKKEFNAPKHYHEHEIDTIEFLQRGFPPDVFTSFCRANIVKYTQRADYKNGRDDILKVVDYAKRWLDWYDKTHS